MKLALGAIISFHHIDNQWNNIEFDVMKLQNETMYFRYCFIYSFKTFLVTWHSRKQ
jgi:hypothetical protein